MSVLRCVIGAALLGACAGGGAPEPAASAPRPVAIALEDRSFEVAGVDLGRLPRGVRVRAPAAPQLVHTVVVRDEATAAQAARRPNTAIEVHADLERLVIAADDIEVRSHARIDRLVIERGRRRIAIVGGRYGAIELPVPAQHVPPPVQWRPEWLAEDITIRNVAIEASDTALALRGRRIAVLDSRARAHRYSVWCGDTEDFHSEDLVLAGNRFESEGPESTVRLVNVRRAVVVDNELVNGVKHDFRVHGASDAVVFARNRLLNTGIMVGSMDGDRIGSVFLLDNRVFHRAPSLLEAPPQRIERLVANGNRVYSDRWQCFVCGTPGERWQIGDNPVARYRPPVSPRSRAAR